MRGANNTTHPDTAITAMFSSLFSLEPRRDSNQSCDAIFTISVLNCAAIRFEFKADTSTPPHAPQQPRSQTFQFNHSHD
jgi:hypothetical protein